MVKVKSEGEDTNNDIPLLLDELEDSLGRSQELV